MARIGFSESNAEISHLWRALKPHLTTRKRIEDIKKGPFLCPFFKRVLVVKWAFCWPRLFCYFEYFQDVACGLSHTVAVTAEGDVVGWGLNSNMQLLAEPRDPSGISLKKKRAKKMTDVRAKCYFWKYISAHWHDMKVIFWLFASIKKPYFLAPFFPLEVVALCSIKHCADCAIETFIKSLCHRKYLA